jgi:hypothetical protein
VNPCQIYRRIRNQTLSDCEICKVIQILRHGNSKLWLSMCAETFVIGRGKASADELLSGQIEVILKRV